MSDVFSQVWATDPSAEIDVPSQAEIALGFRCGPASPGRFNWLFQTIMSAINALNIGDMASKFRLIDTTEGIQGGGDLQADRTLRLDINGLQPKVAASDNDLIVLYDPVDNAHRKQTRAQFAAGFGGGGGSITGGANVGTGAGVIFKDVSGTNLRFRRILAAGGVTVAVSGDDVTIATADRGAALTVI